MLSSLRGVTDPFTLSTALSPSPSSLSFHLELSKRSLIFFPVDGEETFIFLFYILVLPSSARLSPREHLFFLDRRRSLLPQPLQLVHRADKKTYLFSVFLSCFLVRGTGIATPQRRGCAGRKKGSLPPTLLLLSSLQGECERALSSTSFSF